MLIQWFPGHMTKALRMMQDELKVIDLLIYVLDARAVKSSFNPAIEDLAKNKKIVYVLNKCDLADKSITDLWEKRFESEEKKFITLQATNKNTSKMLLRLILDTMSDKINASKQRGINKTVRVMVAGVPNCGKSTIINSLAPVKKTVTGNKPGVTRGKQWVKITDNVELLDTPGTLWPDLGNIETGINLAAIGSIKDEILDIEELSLELINKINILYPEALKNRYSLNADELNSAEVLSYLAMKRGYMFKGNQPDTLRAGKAILDDFRKGRLGKISLENTNEK